jgi:hypothetical protein
MRPMKDKTNDELLDKIIRLMRTDDAADAPADSVRWAKNLFRARGVAEPEKSLVRKVLAVLRTDLSGGQAIFGERSGGMSATRQMLFQAGDSGVDLRVEKTETGFSVRGQILGEGFANCVVRLGDFETQSNELSEFKFAAVAAGKYDLVLRTDEEEILIEGLELL